eukprot:jgi/Mesen1/4395/ME000223S03463
MELIQGLPLPPKAFLPVACLRHPLPVIALHLLERVGQIRLGVLLGGTDKGPPGSPQARHFLVYDAVPPGSLPLGGMPLPPGSTPPGGSAPLPCDNKAAAESSGWECTMHASLAMEVTHGAECAPPEKVALEQAGMAFAPAGDQVIHVSSFTAASPRPSGARKEPAILVHHLAEQGADTRLASHARMCCVLVTAPGVLVAAGEGGHAQCWQMGPSWR